MDSRGPPKPGAEGKFPKPKARTHKDLIQNERLEENVQKPTNEGLLHRQRQEEPRKPRILAQRAWEYWGLGHQLEDLDLLHRQRQEEPRKPRILAQRAWDY
jgi:hypothetical protein